MLEEEVAEVLVERDAGPRRQVLGPERQAPGAPERVVHTSTVASGIALRISFDQLIARLAGQTMSAG